MNGPIPVITESVDEIELYYKDEILYEAITKSPIRFSSYIYNYFQFYSQIMSHKEKKYDLKLSLFDLNDEIIDSLYIQLNLFQKEIESLKSRLFIYINDVFKILENNLFFDKKYKNPNYLDLSVFFSVFFDHYFKIHFRKIFLNKNTSVGRYLLDHISNIQIAFENLITNYDNNPNDYYSKILSSSLKCNDNISIKLSNSMIAAIFGDRKLALSIHNIINNYKGISKNQIISTQSSINNFFNDPQGLEPFKKLCIFYNDEILAFTSRRSRLLFLHQLFEIFQISVAFDKNSVEQSDENKDKKNVYQDYSKRKERKIAQLVPDLK